MSDPRTICFQASNLVLGPQTAAYLFSVSWILISTRSTKGEGGWWYQKQHDGNDPFFDFGGQLYTELHIMVQTLSFLLGYLHGLRAYQKVRREVTQT
jgi:hypothetical protein